MNYQTLIPTGHVRKALLLGNVLMALVYFSWWFMPTHIGNPTLFFLLFFGEVYHVGMALAFWFSLWPTRRSIELQTSSSEPTVDVFITVAGEPADVIAKTVWAAKHMHYRNHRVYILNDGYVTKKPNWKDAEKVGQDLGVTCITRYTSGGAKAGNINNAMWQTTGEVIVLFDADMVPHPDFLQKVMPYFQNQNIGFVQTPQYYKNSYMNIVSETAWEQQALFFGPIMRGKDRQNSAFICGTNVAIRRNALQSVGGMYEKNIAEDFLTSLFIHQKGWESVYLSEVLAEGLAPEDLLSYYKQQLRWARGSLEVLFGFNPLFKSNLTLAQRINYLSSSLYWFNGIIVLIDYLVPIIVLFTGIQAVAAATTSFAIFFIPFIFLSLLTLFQVTEGKVSFRALSFAQASFMLQLQALISTVFRHNMGFSVTSKRAISGNFIALAYPHIIYSIIGITACVVGILRDGVTPSVMTNVAWVFFNIILFVPFIFASLRPTSEQTLQLMPFSQRIEPAV